MAVADVYVLFFAVGLLQQSAIRFAATAAADSVLWHVI